MAIPVWVAFLPVAYLVGSIPFSVYLVRWATGQDVRQAGSGNPGATNALRLAGPKVGILTLLCDVTKGILPVTAGRILGVEPLGLGLIAVAVVVGHVYSVLLGFRGGKGVATAAGALGALSPWAMLAAVLLFFVITLTTGFVSLGSVGASLGFPLLWLLFAKLGWMAGPNREVLVCAILVVLLIAYKHSINFRRIRERTERRLGELRPDEAEPSNGADSVEAEDDET
ncbi:MAG: glycerol-3-phosphate 1-O-acyltransferase PlsY [Thermoanaerobaculia bacterium]|nr:glycerol-3-phosphate 1-O-acyltransferase PlsY [Thermoanaerobaculia bacterium]